MTDKHCQTHQFSKFDKVGAVITAHSTGTLQRIQVVVFQYMIDGTPAARLLTKINSD